MDVLVTGGAGFIGSWVVKGLLDRGCKVVALDDLSNGSMRNISNNMIQYPESLKFIEGDVRDNNLLRSLFDENNFEVCFHLAASINVQDSIDNPRLAFENDTVGAVNVLEQCRRVSRTSHLTTCNAAACKGVEFEMAAEELPHGQADDKSAAPARQCKLVFMSTCMVYDMADMESDAGINELHPTKASSPYAGSKIAAENMVMSFWYAYGHPITIIRPFNTYGPLQKSSGEGGVIAIFIKNALDGKAISIYGDGRQTRDFLYVEDCADFVIRAGLSARTNGRILNAGFGKDISINQLAHMISGGSTQIKHIRHIHPQSEIARLLCNYDKAEELLGWTPKISLEEGIRRTREWIEAGEYTGD